jgi:hypothetical protein
MPSRSSARKLAPCGCRPSAYFVLHDSSVSPPGWSAFEPQRIDELRRSTTSADAPCPFNGHDGERLPWRSGDYRKGTEFHGDPAVSFRVSPTYVLKEARDNFIVGQELLEQLAGKAETWRLGNENSEDALSFNVFRSLQEAGALGEAARLLAGVDAAAEPELIVWGHRLDQASAHLVPELEKALKEMEPWSGQKTEPDVILRLPGWGWIFVEAKLASPTSTLRGKPEKLKAWGSVYGGSRIFDLTAVAAADEAGFPEQLLRNVAIAHRVAGRERVAVVALVRDKHKSSVDGWATDYLVEESIYTGSATWEQLYALTEAREKLARLRAYMADKSVNLRRAFRL